MLEAVALITEVCVPKKLAANSKRHAGAGGSFIEKSECAWPRSRGTRLARLHAPRELKKERDFIRREVLEFSKRGVCAACSRNAFHQQDLLFLSISLSLTSIIFRVAGLTVRRNESVQWAVGVSPR